MKKALISIALLFAATFTYAQEEKIDSSIAFIAGDFMFSDGQAVDKGLDYALIINKDGTGFNDFELTDGDVLSVGTAINETSPYDVIYTDKLLFIDDVWMAMTEENVNVYLDNPASAAIVVWANADFSVADTSTVEAGMVYAFVTNDDWVVQPANDNNNFEALSKNVGGEADLVLDKVVVAVPEPSTYAAIFGALALGFVAYRKRK